MYVNTDTLTGAKHFIKLVMLNYSYFSKELAHIKNIVIDVTEPEHPSIFTNSFPYIKECYYKPYDPNEVISYKNTNDLLPEKRISPKMFSNISFGATSEFIISNCDNLVRCTYHEALSKWFFSTNKKIFDTEISLRNKINVNVLNKKYIYTFNLCNFRNETLTASSLATSDEATELQLISVHTHSGIYTRKLPLHFFKTKSNVCIASSDELIDKIKKFGSVIYFNPKIKCYIKLMNPDSEPLTEQFSYLIRRAENGNTGCKFDEKISEFQPNKKIETLITWLPDYILNCYHRKAINKNIKFNIEEFYIMRKIYGEKNLLEKIEAELKKSTPKQLNNLINSMLEFYESCVS
jgi:hypothetical protein